MTPTSEGFFWYKHPEHYLTIVETEYRPDSGELYAFCIGFSGGTPVRLMMGKWMSVKSHLFKYSNEHHINTTSTTN